MAHPPPYPDTGDDSGVESGRGSTAGPPRWMAAAGIIVAIVVLSLFVFLHLSGSVGPGAH